MKHILILLVSACLVCCATGNKKTEEPNGLCEKVMGLEYHEGLKEWSVSSSCTKKITCNSENYCLEFNSWQDAFSIEDYTTFKERYNPPLSP